MGAASSQGTGWAVPIGRRELLGVTDMKEAPDGSTNVGFDWKWAPNETGTALRNTVPKASAFFDQTRKGRAACRPVGDKWRCELAAWSTAADGLGEFRP